MNRATHAKVLAGGMALALIAAACGGDNKSSTGGGAATTAPAATTAAPSPTTTAASTTTSASGPAAFKVDDSKCPADAKVALAAGADIKMGVTLPQTGQLAAFGAIATGITTYFDKVNAEEGGVDGHKLTLVAKDDAYDPTKSLPLVTELIQSDKVLGTVFQVGTPNVAASRALHEQTCTPQLWVGSGFPAWGDPKNHQWTIGGILAYNTEAKIWAEYIAKQKPGAKVAMLIFNNDFGKAYQTTFEKAAKDKGLTIVETKLHEGTAANIDNEVTAILAANPDYVIGGTTGAFCPKLMAGLAQGGYQGKTIISATCASVKSFFAPVDPAGNGVLILVQQKDPIDPAYAADPAMVQYKADVAKYGAGGDANNASILTGYNGAALVVSNLKAAAKLPGGLTRVNVMDAAWNTNFTRQLLVGGTSKVNGNNDAYVAEYAAMAAYDASKKSQVLTGEVFDVEGKTGVFGA